LLLLAERAGYTGLWAAPRFPDWGFCVRLGCEL
jgi:hypothetical protein